VPVDKRKAFFWLFVAGVTGGLLFPFAIYFIGLALAPPPPVPSTTAPPSLVADAIWARANGGQATALTPISPVSMGKFLACIAIEDFKDKSPGDAQRIEACRGYMPALQGVEYLSGVHMREANLKPSFREGLGRFSTTVWLTRSWTKTEFLNTIAERAQFRFGFRGIEAAARGFFGRPAAELTLPQAALLVVMIDDQHLDPWCDLTGAAVRRRRVLERMRDNLVIDDAALEQANAAELGLTTPPPAHKPCDS
jgi:hypothetical protein